MSLIEFNNDSKIESRARDCDNELGQGPGCERWIYRQMCLRGEGRQDFLYENCDFIAANNAYALACARFGVIPLYLIMLTNHLHDASKSKLDDRAYGEFIQSFRISLTKAVRKAQYGCGRIGEDRAQIKIIKTLADLKDSIAYGLSNPRQHKVKESLWKYRWSTIGMYFTDYKIENSQIIKKPALISTYLPSHRSLPDGYLMDRNGMILPECYVDKRSVESLFGNRTAFANYINTPTQREKNKEYRREDPLDFPLRYDDCELIAMIGKYALERGIPPKSFDQYSINEKRMMANYIFENELSYSLYQISRVLHIPMKTLYSIRSRQSEQESKRG